MQRRSRYVGEKNGGALRIVWKPLELESPRGKLLGTLSSNQRVFRRVGTGGVNLLPLQDLSP